VRCANVVNQLTTLTASELVELVRTRAVSRRAVVEAHAAAIEARNAEVNAFVDLRLEEALVEAAAADSRDELEGKALDGVPLAIKDSNDVAGMATTLGVPARRDLVAPRDDVIVSRLRAAGGIVLGKTNLPDLAIRWNTISSLYGATRNPHDLARSAGGSSGGDAAAVAAGMAPVGIGADYGGSIRVPATFCGIVGFRPTTGVVPKASVLPPHDFAPSHDLMASVGPLARSVDDLELVFDVLRGESFEDPVSVPAELPPATGRPRVALLLDETGATIDGAIGQALCETAARLSEAGFEIADGVAPDLRRAPELWGEIIGTELIEAYLPKIRSSMGESGLQHVEAMHGSFSLGPSVERYLAAVEERRALARAMYAWMQDYPLVLAPVAGMTPPPLDFDHLLDAEATCGLFDRMRSVIWVNLFGLPAVALGNGVQIVAGRFRDRQALAVARIAREALGPVRVAAAPAGAFS
jgi:amidase